MPFSVLSQGRSSHFGVLVWWESINSKYQHRFHNGFWALLAPGSFVPGLAAKAPTGISQEGSQLSRDFTFACVLYIKVGCFFFYFSWETKKAWEVLFIFWGRCFSVQLQAVNLTGSHVLFSLVNFTCAHTGQRHWKLCFKRSWARRSGFL